MDSQQIDAALVALRRQLGDDRFSRFVYALRGGHDDRIYFWQDEVLDRLEAEAGIALPRSPEALRPIFLPLVPVPETLPEIEVPDWISIDSLSGVAPVQGEGRADDAAWYFRARWGGWSIALSQDPQPNPVDVSTTTETTFYHEELYGDRRYDASYMPLDEARYFIVRELSRWRTESSK